MQLIQIETLPVIGCVKPVVLEAGHYYESKGPTAWSHKGWDILNSLARPQDARLLFVDDVHSLEDVSECERRLSVIDFEPTPGPTHLVTESSVLPDAFKALKKLRQLSRRKRARITGSSKVMRCSGHSLINGDGTPLCLFYDLGLTWQKYHMGYRRGINILPMSYAQEQQRLLKIVRKALPDFHLDVILYDLNGGYWQLPSTSH